MVEVKNLIILAMAVTFISSCQTGNKEDKLTQMGKFDKGSFGYDLEFLRSKDSVVVLRNNGGNAQVIVSATYQGKVFSSTADGPKGKSFGWINYKAFDGAPDPHMNGYGGEDRLWLGPEGGKYSIFFKPGTKMEFKNWHTPPAFDTESWTLHSANKKAVSMSKDMSLQNYAGTLLKLRIDRDVKILEIADIEKALGIDLSKNVKSVGFETNNTLTNTSDIEWTGQTGTPCMWNLNMFSVSSKMVIVIPYIENATGKVATTDYFGQIPANRVTYQNGTLYFKADGKSRGKLGIALGRAKPVAGSYDGESILTISSFDVDNKGTYLNQEWTTEKDPLVGDAVNAYNDGPLEDGSQLGPFYEIESVSPAAFLKPQAKLFHKHSVFHFIGDKTELNQIAVKVLSVSLDEIESAFKQ